jgi:hypothetical protein
MWQFNTRSNATDSVCNAAADGQDRFVVKIYLGDTEEKMLRILAHDWSVLCRPDLPERLACIKTVVRDDILCSQWETNNGRGSEVCSQLVLGCSSGNSSSLEMKARYFSEISADFNQTIWR